jgi:hypothetical protein
VSNQGLRYRAGDGPASTEPERFEGRARDAVWMRVTFEVDGGRIRIPEIAAVPLWTRNNHYERWSGREERVDIRLVRLAALESERLRAERREHVAQILGPDVTLVE